MATSRTGTAKWKRLRTATIRAAQRQGITNCPACGIRLDYQAPRAARNAVEVDHIIAHANGGQDTRDNAGILCGPCNRRLGKKTPRTLTTPGAHQATPVAPTSITPTTSRDW